MHKALSSLEGNVSDLVSVKRALLSVSDKTDLAALARSLVNNGIELLSTGGTAKAIRDAGVDVTDIGDYTGFPEILDGRVKTLHPKVHGGLLAVRGNEKHEKEAAENGIQNIDLVVMNLYRFEETVKSGADFNQCIENIDIGGPSMLRSAAKNHAYVTIVTSPSQYSQLLDELREHCGTTTLKLRREFASQAFTLSAQYDGHIAKYFAAQLGDKQQSAKQQPSSTSPPYNDDVITRTYKPELTLKYGCNPHQKPSTIYSHVDASLPFTVLSGQPGYINLLDAVNSWQLVSEACEALGGNIPVAASFKHCSPAGVALGHTALTPEEVLVYDIVSTSVVVTETKTFTIPTIGHHKPNADEATTTPPPADVDASPTLSPTAIAYIRARNCDPLCSYGDFAALSHTVDLCTAQILQTTVCDGIIAPGFDEQALDILRRKKKGAFIILQANPDFVYEHTEFREVAGVVFSQGRNDVLVTEEHLRDIKCTEGQTVTTTTPAAAVAEQPPPSTVVATTIAGDVAGVKHPGPSITLPPSVTQDLILALITAKYTQSNSVTYALNGKVIGVGAGQQSRVDCVKLAGRKVSTWYLRHHPKVLHLPFKETVRKQDRINARVRYIADDISASEMTNWLTTNFTSPPEPLTETEKIAFMTTLGGVSIASDGFFPFRDNIDQAAQFGVKYIAQPGGSIADDEVIAACNEYGMTMAFTHLRLFHH